MLHEFINKKYLNEKEIKKINKRFIGAEPYPHFVLDNFFILSKILRLRKAVLREKFERIDKDLFSFSHTKDLISSEKEEIKSFYSFVSSKEFISLIEKFTSEKLIQKIDMQAHIFERGDYLLFHDDDLEERKIAYILYLSHGFAAKDGGKLQLYDAKTPICPVKEIIPKFNSFVCFKVSKKSLHAVEEIMNSKQRLTVGGWFYGD